MSTYGYKVLNEDGTPLYGSGASPLPHDGEPGDWHAVEGPLIACENGLHYCRTPRQLVRWLGPAIYQIEIADEAVPEHDEEKSATLGPCRLIERLPWDERRARLFAADCAEHVLSLYVAVCPEDDRPREAIAAARRFARREITDKQRFAAESAAESAAWSAARAAAAVAAELDWQAERLAFYLSGGAE